MESKLKIRILVGTIITIMGSVWIIGSTIIGQELGYALVSTCCYSTEFDANPQLDNLLTFVSKPNRIRGIVDTISGDLTETTASVDGHTYHLKGIDFDEKDHRRLVEFTGKVDPQNDSIFEVEAYRFIPYTVLTGRLRKQRICRMACFDALMFDVQYNNDIYTFALGPLDQLPELWEKIGKTVTLAGVIYTGHWIGYTFDIRYICKEAKGIERIGDPRLRALLAKNGFAVTPDRTYAGVEEFYQWLDRRGIPIFVSTDAILHTSHVLFDYMLRIVEIERLRTDLMSLSRALVDLSFQQHEQAIDPLIKEAALGNAMFFSVALKLLDGTWPIPEVVREKVEAEIALIEAHAGWKSSPGFEDPQSLYLYQEDYSQYVPRGHYTRNKEFEGFFKAMMWYGRMIFPLPNGESWQVDSFLKRVTRQALLITQALMDSPYQVPLMEIWERIYEPTAFFVERSDDLTVHDYIELMQQVYSETWRSVDSFADESKLFTFIAEAMNLRDPKIASGIKWTEEMRPDAFYNKGFKFMGQRFTPGSYIFQELVFDKVGQHSLTRGYRLLPKGLDIMAVLGSETAEEILKDEGDFEFKGYEEQLEKLKEEFSSLSVEEWTKTLYWSWLYSLGPLLEEKHETEGYPLFMETEAWMKKALNSALASWAELRHDTILYVKQSYTAPKSAPPPPPKGYVEPYPEVYRRIADLVKQMREDLERQGLLIPEVSANLTKFEDLLRGLERISEKELRGEALTEEEYHLIRKIGDNLSRITCFPDSIMEKIAGTADARMMVIADVHTDANTKQVLEEGVGYPFHIYVIAPIEGELVLTEGAVFSYYEFPWPMDDRLTDEKWQEILEAGEEPDLPEWTEAFMVQ